MSSDELDYPEGYIVWRCPRCGALGRIDEDQKSRKVSIICPDCGWHGYYSKSPKPEK